MLFIVEDGIRGGICHAIHQYVKTKNKYMKDYDEKKESSYFQYWGVNDLYGWAQCHKSCLWAVLSGLKIHLNLVKISQKTKMNILMKDIFLKLMFIILKNYMTFTVNFPFCLKE